MTTTRCGWMVRRGGLLQHPVLVAQLAVCAHVSGQDIMSPPGRMDSALGVPTVKPTRASVDALGLAAPYRPRPQNRPQAARGRYPCPGVCLRTETRREMRGTGFGVVVRAREGPRVLRSQSGPPEKDQSATRRRYDHHNASDDHG